MNNKLKSIIKESKETSRIYTEAEDEGNEVATVDADVIDTISETPSENPAHDDRGVLFDSSTLKRMVR